jgi:phage tail sheath protein FI
MALYLSPLVDVKEIDLTTTIPAVATSIAVTVIRDPYKGPELKQQLITTVDELITIFGEPTSGSFKDILSSVGYLNYGNKLYATAAYAVSATFAGCHGVFASAGELDGYNITPSGAYMIDDFEARDPDQYHTESVPFDENREDYGSSISFIAKSRGKWGNYIKIALVGKNLYNRIRSQAYTYTQLNISSELYDDIDSVDVSFDSETDTEFIVIVKVADQDQITRANPVFFVREAMFVSTNERKLDDEGGNIYCENLINQTSNFIRCNLASVAKNTDMSDVFTDYENMSGGQNRPNTEVTDAAIIEAFEIYEDAETVDVNILIDSDKSITVKQRLMEIAESRKDCIAILDVPSSLVLNNSGQEATDMRDFRLGLHSTYNLNENTSYAALYGNWLEIYDKWNGKYRWIPASGHIAGIYANTDDVTDPWFAPAGLNRGIIGNIRKLAFNPNQGKRDIMYKNGINPIVSFAGQGKVVWGQKTYLDKSSAFNRVNVRRLFIILEKAISTAVKYFLFEPNDSFTRLQLINMIEPFLRDVKSRRGIYDFLVVCDSTNNTPERIDRNELWCDIYIKPTRAAEFIVLNFIATKTGASFTEIAATAAGATA